MSESYQHYILDKENTPVAASDEDYWEWHDVLGSHEQTVLGLAMAQEDIGKMYVSTVFTGVADAGKDSKGDPYLFETIVIGGKFNGTMRRYTTWEDATRGHASIVGLVDEREPV